jgi:5'-deoxynucleotidase YfbR-like HD superfamily hydrolase
MKLSFYELARTSHIKRWTIINTTREQNLAEHQYNVTVIALALYKAVTGEKPTATFIAAALFHDSAEIRYGDIPTPAKAHIRKIAESAGAGNDLFEVMDTIATPDIPYIGGKAATEEAKIIKLADLIEAAWWIRENGAGHHAGTVADKCWRAVEEYVHDFGMYREVNPILMDLGLPFVNGFERITPP